MKSEGEAAAVLAMDATLQAHAKHWLVRETIGLLRRSLARLDVSSRSLFALIEPGSCFAGSFFELALACDRSYMLMLPDDAVRSPKLTLGEANFGPFPMLPMITGQTRLERRFCGEDGPLAAARAGPYLSTCARSGMRSFRSCRARRSVCVRTTRGRPSSTMVWPRAVST